MRKNNTHSVLHTGITEFTAKQLRGRERVSLAGWVPLMVGVGRLGNGWAGKRVANILGLGKNKSLVEIHVHIFRLSDQFVVLDGLGPGCENT